MTTHRIFAALLAAAALIVVLAAAGCRTPEPTVVPTAAPTQPASPSPTPPPAPTAAPPTPTSTPSPTAGSANTDRAALVALYHATNGDNWTKNTNWMSDAHPGQWHGVTTDDNGRVIGLYLYKNKLTSTIPASLSNLAGLQELSLDGNQLKGEIPAGLGDLANLEYLSLNDNQLTGGIPSELGNLTNLQGLYISGNQLTGCLPKVWQVSTGHSNNDLDRLGLPFCETSPDEIHELSYDRATLLTLYNAMNGSNWIYSDNWNSNLPVWKWHGVAVALNGRVNELNLSDNQLTGEIPAELGNLAHLRELYLGRNQLTGAIPAELGRLDGLYSLFLDDNQLTGEIPAELGNLDLLSLILRDNQLTGGIPAELGNLANLRNLDIRDNQLTGGIPAELGNLANLRNLWLDGNQLTGEIPAELGNLAGLELLWLSGNQLTGEIPSELGNLANLTSLWLDGNQLTGCIPESLRKLGGNLRTPGLVFCDLSSDDLRLIADDRAVLVALYSATGGPNWDDNSNWLSDAPLGQWHGVTTDGNGRVIQLRLNDNRLTGGIPTELGNLVNLGHLYLSGNHLTGCVPQGLSDVPNNDFASLALPFCNP